MPKCITLKLLWLLVPSLVGLINSVHADTAEVAPIPANPASALQLPAGFSAQVFARVKPMAANYFSGPRMMTFGPDGHLYLSLGMGNAVLMLPDDNHDGVADSVVLVADKLNAPQGLVFVDKHLLVANQDGVVSLDSEQGWPAKKIEPLISQLPAGGHALKSLKLGPDGYLYLSVGSSCNVCEELDPVRATILRYSVTGQPAGALTTLGRHTPSAVWATGLRNSQGLAWHPASQALYATNDGADMRAKSKNGKVDDDIPPEHINVIQAGQYYGWPYCWGDGQAGVVADPNMPGASAFCANAQAPAITLPAHSTPIGMSFLHHAQVPERYKNDALVALHGSWNRKQASGYKIVRIKFTANGQVVKADNAIEDFASGWLSRSANGEQAWGRPVDIIVGPDGAIYVSDDRAGLVYRISYKN